MIKRKLKYAEVSKIILLGFIPAMIIILLLGVAKHFILQYEINRNLEHNLFPRNFQFKI